MFEAKLVPKIETGEAGDRLTSRLGEAQPV